MASLLEKFSTLISANMHALVDAALKGNSVAVIDQYIRQVEDNLVDLDDAAATVGGEVKSIKRRLIEHEQRQSELDRGIDAFQARATRRLRWRCKASSTAPLVWSRPTKTKCAAKRASSKSCWMLRSS